MTVRLKASVRDAALNAALDLTDAGSGPGTLKIYTGTIPANADAGVGAGTLLCTLTLADPAFEVASGGSKDIDANPDIAGTAVATGTAAWARVADSAGNTVFDGSVATSAADFVITSTSIVSGQTVTLVSGTITFPAT